MVVLEEKKRTAQPIDLDTGERLRQTTASPTSQSTTAPHQRAAQHPETASPSPPGILKTFARIAFHAAGNLGLRAHSLQATTARAE